MMAAKNRSTPVPDRTFRQNGFPLRPLPPGAGIALGIILGLVVWVVLVSVVVMLYAQGDPP